MARSFSSGSLTDSRTASIGGSRSQSSSLYGVGTSARAQAPESSTSGQIVRKSTRRKKQKEQPQDLRDFIPLGASFSNSGIESGVQSEDTDDQSAGDFLRTTDSISDEDRPFGEPGRVGSTNDLSYPNGALQPLRRSSQQQQRQRAYGSRYQDPEQNGDSDALLTEYSRSDLQERSGGTNVLDDIPQEPKQPLTSKTLDLNGYLA
ncbi:MAG: hypothetical protein M1833_005125 [Piccolia ochrophora]|nr:MAG: hypothetical protein M1833_005125 [Piccolia ochrophora]